MIRGKATEYMGVIILQKTLNHLDWIVGKMNLNAQPGTSDEDLSITNRRTGKKLRAETKNANRGKFSMGTRNNRFPHFPVKCHRSRSHMTRERNDRYLASEFDVLLCNPSNALFRATKQRGLPLIEDQIAIKWLKEHYEVCTDEELRHAAYNDWRVCFPRDIADDDNTIPRSPRVLMVNDPNWFALDQLDAKLLPLRNGDG